jgi:hypothetical protein
MDTTEGAINIFLKVDFDEFIEMKVSGRWGEAPLIIQISY